MLRARISQARSDWYLKRRVRQLQRRVNDPHAAPLPAFDPARRARRHVVSMAALPQRYAVLPVVLEALMDISPKPQAIHLWLDRRYRDMTLPPAMKLLEKRGLMIHHVRDIGPHTKWWYLADYEDVRETDVVICDDDRIYAPGPLNLRLALATGGQRLVYSSEALNMAVAHYAFDDPTWSAQLLGGDTTEYALSACYRALERSFPEVAQCWPWMTLLINNLGTVLDGAVMTDPAVRDLHPMLRVAPYHDDAWLWSASVAARFQLVQGGPVAHTNTHSLRVARLVADDDDLISRAGKGARLPMSVLGPHAARLERDLRESESESELAQAVFAGNQGRGAAKRAQEATVIEHFGLQSRIRELARDAHPPLCDAAIAFARLPQTG